MEKYRKTPQPALDPHDCLYGLCDGAYKGRPVYMVWFGLWSHFGIQKQDGGDQVGSRFFPSVLWNIVFDQTDKNLQKWKQYLTIPKC